MVKQIKPELVAPAGSFEHMKAAVANGADAVYFGYQAFNARIGAQNFSPEQVKEAIDYLHLHGRKAYLTLNILLNEFEIGAAIDMAKSAYEHGIDAVIVQDVGLAHSLHELLPGLRLHASTQMTIHNTEGLLFAKDLGIKRAVLARENSVEEIHEMKSRVGTGIEVECFVHGAMCVAYSGQCFASSVSFKRSGNRGRCAQNCRLFYDLEEGGKRIDEGYLLSQKDLFAVPMIKQLAEAGVSAFKIEGRKKGTEYVAIATRVYRKAIDNAFGGKEAVSEDEIKQLRIAYNRDFSAGHFNGKNDDIIKKDYPGKVGIRVAKVLEYADGKIKVQLFERVRKWDKLSHKLGDERVDFFAKKILKNGKEMEHAFANEIVEIEVPHEIKKGWTIFKVQSKQLTDLAYSSIKTMKKPEVNLEAKISHKEFRIRAFDGQTSAEVVSDFTPKKAEKIPLGEKVAEEKLSKTGETLFELKSISVKVDEGLMVPFSKLNDLRRKAIDAFTKKKLEGFRKNVDAKKFEERKKELLKDAGHEKGRKAAISVKVSSLKQLNAFLQAKPCAVSFPENADKKTLLEAQKICSEHAMQLVLSTPVIMKDHELAALAKKLSETVKGKSAELAGAAIECNNLGLYHWLAGQGFEKIIIGKNLNVFNSIAANFFAKNPQVERILPSGELTLKQLSATRKRTDAKIELVAFELPEIMIIETKILPKKGRYTLIDRNKWKYAVELDESERTHLYNPMAMNMVPELEKLEAIADVVRVDVGSVSGEDAEKIIASVKEKLGGGKGFADMPFTRASYEKAV
ncbi:MAG: U32 family peptidase [Candidatus Diapherotrites archaeon]|nr:U32 family peptidase [Candidatus Diapherotrites archaeon]